MADFSCYGTIDNTTLQTFYFTEKGSKWGLWDVDPPSSITAGTCSGEFRLKDSTGPSGTEGFVKYSTADGTSFTFSFSCPYAGNNYVRVDKSGYRSKDFEITFEARSGNGPWQKNSCPITGHPVSARHAVKQLMPRKPTAAEVNTLQAAFPLLDTDGIWIVREPSKTYNCIAWSLGIDYVWINPPAVLNDFKDLYRTAASSDHGGTWKAANNWVPTRKLAHDSPLDGWGQGSGSGSPGNVMTHASRFLNSSDFPQGAWTSKLGDQILITHDRESLVSNMYGDVLVSFKKQTITTELEAMKAHLKRLTGEDFFTGEEKRLLQEQFNRVSPALKKQFDTAYGKWEKACAEKMPWSSDTYDRARVPEFRRLTRLGKDIVPLLIQKMLAPEGFFALVVYEAVQPKSYWVRYKKNDPLRFEGEQARALRTVKLWLERQGKRRRR